MNNPINISFGDTVKVVSNEITKRLAIDNKIGEVFGETNPSLTNVDITGANENDFAFNVHFENDEKEYWLSPELVELVNHTPGLEIRVGNVKATRTENGEWIEERVSWWKFWKK